MTILIKETLFIYQKMLLKLNNFYINDGLSFFKYYYFISFHVYYDSFSEKIKKGKAINNFLVKIIDIYSNKNEIIL